MSEETQQVLKQIFNAKLQTETAHSLEVDDNGEILATCTETGAQLKFPNVSEEEFDALVAKHKEANLGQRIRKPLFGGVVAQPEPAQEVEVPAEPTQPE